MNGVSGFEEKNAPQNGPSSVGSESGCSLCKVNLMIVRLAVLSIPQLGLHTIHLSGIAADLV